MQIVILLGTQVSSVHQNILPHGSLSVISVIWQVQEWNWQSFLQAFTDPHVLHICYWVHNLPVWQRMWQLWYTRACSEVVESFDDSYLFRSSVRPGTVLWQRTGEAVSPLSLKKESYSWNLLQRYKAPEIVQEKGDMIGKTSRYSIISKSTTVSVSWEKGISVYEKCVLIFQKVFLLGKKILWISLTLVED